MINCYSNRRLILLNLFYSSTFVVMATHPQLVLLFSGKRKSGKDYITEKVYNALGDDVCEIIRISHPIKAHWAKHKSLDLDQLLSDGAYKENFRKEMIEWSESVRNEDYGYFCRTACANISRPVCIVSDIRRRTDLQWFKENYGSKIQTVRVIAPEYIRIGRGWEFTKGIDDVASECDLDDVQLWDIILQNDNENTPEELVELITDCVQEYVKLKN